MTMTWPVDRALPERGGAPLELTVQGRRIGMSRVGPEHLSYRPEAGADEVLVGVEESASIARFIPTMGPLPLLAFPRSRLLCPGRGQLSVWLVVSIYVELGVGRPDAPLQAVDAFAPPRVPRALYGPVDNGTICRSAHSPVAVDLERARAQLDTLGEDEPGPHPQLVAPSPALLPLEIQNTTEAPLEVSKIMLPRNLFGLYEHEGDLLMGRYRMTLLGPQEAQLSFQGAPVEGSSPIHDLSGQPVEPELKPLLFVHTYRTKTGLEFGF